MLTGLIFAAALTTSHMPPGAPVVDHSQPSHYAQPTIRRFERRAVDNARKRAYHLYTAELDALWKVYRSAGSTDQAFREYLAAAALAKARYVIGDPYYAGFYDDGSQNGGAGANGMGGAPGMLNGGIPGVKGGAGMPGAIKGGPAQHAAPKGGVQK